VMRKLGMRIERNPLPEPHWLQIVGVLDHPSARASHRGERGIAAHRTM